MSAHSSNSPTRPGWPTGPSGSGRASSGRRWKRSAWNATRTGRSCSPRMNSGGWSAGLERRCGRWPCRGSTAAPATPAVGACRRPPW